MFILSNLFVQSKLRTMFVLSNCIKELKLNFSLQHIFAGFLFYLFENYV